MIALILNNCQVHEPCATCGDTTEGGPIAAVETGLLGLVCDNCVGVLAPALLPLLRLAQKVGLDGQMSVEEAEAAVDR